MLNDIDNALLPQQIVTPDRRKFQVRRNDVLEGDKSQRMKMEGDKDGALNENPVNTGKRTSSAAYKSVDVNDKEHFFSDWVLATLKNLN